MHGTDARHDRRRFLRGLTLGMAALATRGVLAQQLAETAPTGEGPFYPNRLPLDADNDLLIINDSITPAVGEITHLTGRVLTAAGQPVRNAFVEIWQADNTGSYINTSGRQETGTRQKLSGLRPFSERRQGAVLLPHHQTGRLHPDRDLPRSAHSRRDQQERPPDLHHPAPRRGAPGEYPRPLGPGDGSARASNPPGGVPAAPGLEGRRAHGTLRRRAGSNSAGTRQRPAAGNRGSRRSAPWILGRSALKAGHDRRCISLRSPCPGSRAWAWQRLHAGPCSGRPA